MTAGEASEAPEPAEPAPWADALLIAALFAVHPHGTVGAAVRAPAGPVRDRWLAALRAMLPPLAPLRRLPLHAGDDRILGGLDLAATLRAGRPVVERGILAEADGGVLLLAMAERLPAATMARLAAVLDQGEVALQRDGLSLVLPARFGVVAFDEGLGDDERPPAALLDRLAFHLDLGEVPQCGADVPVHSPDTITAARAALSGVQAGPDLVEALCGAALALGIASLRAPLLAVQAARSAAALGGRDAVSKADAALAARLVLAPRATLLPVPARAPEESAGDDRPGEPERGDDAESGGEQAEGRSAPADRPLADIVLEAAEAAIPAGLLAQLAVASGSRSRVQSSGRAGELRSAVRHGRPAGTRKGEPRAGARLNVVETLRAAAPWQRLRRETGEAGAETRIQVRRDDFRVGRFKRRAETTTIFAVDASGSSAFQRLAEAKGAVQLLLADCYVRRDSVALIAFRGQGAEQILPPTRSLVRAKRSLDGLPGGGGTPLASGIDAALAVADAVRRKGQTPILVLLTDGRANIARSGEAGRPRAEADAVAAAQRVRMAGLTALLVDTSPQPQDLGRRLAAEMNAVYLPLPYAGAASLSDAVRVAGASRPV